MKYNPPYGSSDPNAPYINATPGQKGSPVPAEAIEYVQREIVNAITQAGLTPGNEDLGQLWKAMGKAVSNGKYALSAATAGALGGVTVNKGGLQVNSAGLLSLLLATGGGLGLNSAGQAYVDPGAFSAEILNELLKTLRLPQWLTRDTTFYVRPDGNNSNDGLSNTAAGAWKTIQGALNNISADYNLSTYTATIKVLSGIYNEGRIVLPKYNASTGKIILIGESASTVLVNANISSVASAGEYSFCDISIANLGVGSYSEYMTTIYQGCTINFLRVNFQATTPVTVGVGTVVLDSEGGVIKLYEGCTVTMSEGALVSHVIRANSGLISQLRTWTVNGPLQDSFIFLRGLGRFSRGSNEELAPTINGIVAGGKKYDITENSICYTLAAGANYFPGAEAGTLSSGGQYT